ncbi:MAG: hypothetical protein IJZ55_03160 [Lachnospiraceae bacterium]|nr:hypothetical protein [Lachnospiraceae bacterium]
MTKKLTRFFRTFKKRLRRKIKQKIYNFLVAIHEGEIRFSLFYIVCALFLLFLCVGFFFRTETIQESATVPTVFGSELTHALRHDAQKNHRAELDADVTLFLLPDTEDSEAFTSFLNSPLYGFYLSGKEISYLPELYTSFADAFPGGTPYVGGLSYSYNPKRLPYNRATDITLFSENGTHSLLTDDNLYYVVSTEAAFGMFHYLSSRTFGLLHICPKDAAGNVLTDVSGQLLLGAEGSYSFSSIYGDYLLSDSSSSVRQAASEIMFCSSLNTVALYSQLNAAGYFLVGCVILLITLAAAIRPALHRTLIWFRIFLFHQKKRGKISFRNRIYTARTARRHAA